MATHSAAHAPSLLSYFPEDAAGDFQVLRGRSASGAVVCDTGLARMMYEARRAAGGKKESWNPIRRKKKYLPKEVRHDPDRIVLGKGMKGPIDVVPREFRKRIKAQEALEKQQLRAEREAERSPRKRKRKPRAVIQTAEDLRREKARELQAIFRMVR